MEILDTLLRRGVIVVIITSLAVCVLLLGCQRSIMYYPRGYSAERVEDSGAQLLRYSVVGEGEQVAFLMGAETLPETLWIFCGGNGAVALGWESLVSRMGVGAVLFELPGYGLCEGAPDPKSVRESMMAMRVALAQEFGITPEEIDSRVAFVGHSIGAASALIGAEVFGAQRLVLIAPFTTMTEMARRTVGWPLCLLNLHRYDNRERLRSLEDRGGQAAVFHGSADGVIPVEMARALAAEFPRVISLTEVPGAGHNDVIERSGNALRAALR